MPRGRPEKPILDRLLSKVQKRESGCWEFQGARDKKGYGCISAKCYGMQSMGAHRASWIAHRGPIDPGLCVCHKCDNPSCVNPDHLFIGTHQDNAKDMVARGRAAEHVGKFNRFAAKMTEDQVRLMREMAASGATAKELAKEFNTHAVNVRLILRGKTWKGV